MENKPITNIYDRLLDRLRHVTRTGDSLDYNMIYLTDEELDALRNVVYTERNKYFVHG